MKYAVVGTSHVGYEAVQTLLKNDPSAEIHLYERGTTMSFLSCGIHSYLEGISNSLDELHYATADSYAKQGVNVHLNSDVTAIDADAKTLTVQTPEGQTTDSYDKLILSPGGLPAELPASVNGTDLDNVLFMRGRDWAGEVKGHMATAKKAVVIGCGYIGIEAAEAYGKAGIDTTVIDAADRILPTYLDSEFTDVLTKNFEANGVKVRTAEFVQEIKGENGKVTAVVTNKAEYEADTVIIAVGVTPNTTWLSGIVDLDDRGFVNVDEHMQTSTKDIYAAGDATLIPYGPTGGKVNIALATNARRQAVVAARHALGDETARIKAVNGTSALSLFDYKYASTGIGQNNAGSVEGDVKSTYVEEKILPDFMHKDDKVMMKIYYTADEGRILGAQLMSTYDVTAAINTISTAITAKWTLADLADADYFFQPGFDRPWNYLNVLAMTARGELYGADKMIF